MKNKMKIFIDFDDVLFNTKKFKADLIMVFVNNGVSEKQFVEESYWGGKYNLDKQVKSLEKKYGIDNIKLKKDADCFFKNLEKYVFSDVRRFLEQFKKEELFLISYGNKKTQLKKIKNASLDKYFSEIIITKSKSKVISEILTKNKTKNEELYFLDDRIKYIEEIKKTFSQIKTFLIKRPEGRYDEQFNNYCDYTVTNLEEVYKIIFN